MDISPHSGDDRKYRLLMAAVTDYAIFMLDPYGHIVSWDAGAQRAKGYSEAEIIGQHFSVFYTVEDRRRGCPEAALAIARRDGRFESEGWRVRKDGSRFRASAVLDVIYGDDGSIAGFAKITRDITARHEAEQARFETEHRFRLLVEGVTDYAITMLDPEGYVENWNPGGTRIKGYAAAEIVGQHFSRFYTAEDRAAGVPDGGLREATATGRFEDEGWRVRKDGNRFWASVVIDAIYDDDCQLTGFAQITRDLTRQRDAQLRVDEMRQRAAQLEKLESLGWVTSGVAHDFNNILQVISGSAEAAKTMAAGDGKLLGVLDGIDKAVVRGVVITRQLLSFARQTPANPEIVDTSGSIQRAMDLFSRSLRGDVRVERRLESDLWPMRIDIPQFEAALLNIVVNANDAMPDGGVLAVTAANRILNGEPDGLTGSFVAVSVRDSGVGIPHHVLNRILEPFFTTKPAGKGTGLGLSQVHGFARQAGGTVVIASEVNCGTEITMLLPAVPGSKGGERYGGLT